MAAPFDLYIQFVRIIRQDGGKTLEIGNRRDVRWSCNDASQTGMADRRATSRSRVMSKERRGGRGSCSLTPKSGRPRGHTSGVRRGPYETKATASNGGRHALLLCKALAYCQIQSGFPPTRNQVSEWWFHSNGLVFSALDVQTPFSSTMYVKTLSLSRLRHRFRQPEPKLEYPYGLFSPSAREALSRMPENSPEMRIMPQDKPMLSWRHLEYLRVCTCG